MKSHYFYPDDSIVPIEVGDGYKDFLLSSLLPNYRITAIDGFIFRRSEGLVLLNLVAIVENKSGESYWGDFFSSNYCSEDILSKDLFVHATDTVIRIFESQGKSRPFEVVRWVKILCGSDVSLSLKEYVPIYTCFRNLWLLSEVHNEKQIFDNNRCIGRSGK